MIIFTKQTRSNGTTTEYEVRTLGRNYWINKDELLGYANTNQLFFKVNKAADVKAIQAYI